MKKMLNTLYVTTEGAYLFKDGETVAIKIEDKVRMRLPIHTISSIVCFGRVTCSPYLLGHCGENGVSVSFLSQYGRFLARVEGEVSGNVLLRREQYRQADKPDDSALLAYGFIAGKIANTIAVIGRAVRDHGDKISADELIKVREQLKIHLKKLEKENNLDSLRGIEGKAAGDYFNVFDHLIVSSKKDFVFRKRNRRPPLDEVNCLLSFIYTLLYHDARSALETVGLVPSVGVLHRDRPGRFGLALDLMEEFRPFIADRMVLSLINLKKVKKSGFKTRESGAVVMDDDTKRTVLTSDQERKKDEIMHPFLKEKIPKGMLLMAQAQLLSRYFRNDLDIYPPFIWR